MAGQLSSRQDGQNMGRLRRQVRTHHHWPQTSEWNDSRGTKPPKRPTRTRTAAIELSCEMLVCGVNCVEHCVVAGLVFMPNQVLPTVPSSPHLSPGYIRCGMVSGLQVPGIGIRRQNTSDMGNGNCKYTG